MYTVQNLWLATSDYQPDACVFPAYPLANRCAYERQCEKELMDLLCATQG
jgi:hypothetical protein